LVSFALLLLKYARYKLANGKYVVPTPIENCMAGSRHLQQVFVYGSDLRDHNICLMYPPPPPLASPFLSLSQFFRYPNIDAVASTLKIKPDEVLLPHNLNSVVDVMSKDAEICFNAAGIKSYERPAQFGLLPELMTVDNGLLTPKVLSWRCCFSVLVCFGCVLPVLLFYWRCAHFAARIDFVWRR
jgi:long-chain acyl-CoA synthetase